MTRQILLRKLKREALSYFAGLTLILVLNFHALVIHTCLKERRERKLRLQNLLESMMVRNIPCPQPKAELFKLPASFP